MASVVTSWPVNAIMSQPRSVSPVLKTVNYIYPSTFALQDTALETCGSSRKAAWLHPRGFSALRARSPRASPRAPPRFHGDDVIWRGRHRTTNADQCVARAGANSHAV